MKGRTGKPIAFEVTAAKQPGVEMDHAGGTVKKKHGGKVEGKKAKPRADKQARGGGIHIKPSNKGKLHKDLGVAADKKIPAAKLAKAEHSKDPAVRKRAVFAENAKGWKH